MDRTTRPAKGLAVAIAALAALAMVSCGRPPQSTAERPGTTAVATESLADYYVRQLAGVAPDRVPAATRTQLLEDLKKLQSAAAVGERAVMPDTTNAIELSRLEILAHAAAESAGVLAQPTDADLQQAYQSYLQSLPASEYRVAHILVATEPLATAVITELDGGRKFADVAAQRSADDSKSRGGDLGWIRPGHLPVQFFDALKSLKPGEYTKTPIHTAYGWHVIRLIETRAANPPPFDQVKAQLATNLQEDRYRRFLDESAAATKKTHVAN
jgi:peptidyl-prolyl cis-trans isomerase C